MAVPIKFRRGKKFAESWVVATFGKGQQAQDFDNKVEATIRRLLKERPGFGVPTEKPVHVASMSNGYEILYEWETHFDMRGRAVAHFLVLLLVLKEK